MRRCLGGALMMGAVSLMAGCELRYTERGDLDAIREREALRIIVPRRPRQRLPRRGDPVQRERDLAERFAVSLGLEPRFISMADREAMIQLLLDGGGDLLVANFTITPVRERDVAFSTPLGYVREQVVTRLRDTTLRRPEDLAGRAVVVRPSSSYWRTADELRRTYPSLQLIAAPERYDTEEILRRVESGEYDLTIADDNIVDQALGYLPELRVGFDVTGDRATAWAMRPDATELKAAVDSFIDVADVSLETMVRDTGDLGAIRERGTLRVLTRNGAATYFIWRGELLGFEYDLAQRLADRLGVRLEVVVPPTRANLVSWLQQGYGDIVAAGLTPTAERQTLGVTFSRPYHYVAETVVVRADDDLATPEALAGREVWVRRRSSYWATAERLREQGIDVRIRAAPEDLETEQIIDRVARGEYDLTISDSHILDIERTWRTDVRAAFAIGDSVPHGWAVRDANQALLAAVNSFFRSEYRGLWFNLTYNKYFRTVERVEEQVTERVARTGQISPYDSLIRVHAEAFDVDWTLIAAQMYEESRFDPDAVSPVGARGLLQVMPSNAVAMGYADVDDPEQNVEAGVRYLRSQFELFQDEVDEADRIWFALASYNAGYGHVDDARVLAGRMGRDPRRWFGEVEAVMPLLASRDYHERTRHGYCRCQEPVNYVRRIRDKWDAYRLALESAGSR